MLSKAFNVRTAYLKMENTENYDYVQRYNTVRRYTSPDLRCSQMLQPAHEQNYYGTNEDFSNVTPVENEMLSPNLASFSCMTLAHNNGKINCV